MRILHQVLELKVRKYEESVALDKPDLLILLDAIKLSGLVLGVCYDYTSFYIRWKALWGFRKNVYYKNHFVSMWNTNLQAARDELERFYPNIVKALAKGEMVSAGAVRHKGIGFGDEDERLY